MRSAVTLEISSDWIDNLILWLNTQEIAFCFRGTGWGSFSDESFDVFAGYGSIDSKSEFSSESDINEFINSTNDFIVTHLAYDLKNKLESLESNNKDLIGFSEFNLNIPEVLFKVKGNSISILFHPERQTEDDVREVFEEIVHFKPDQKIWSIQKPTWRLSKQQYFVALSELKRQIKLGNIYQANYCQEVFWPNSMVDSAALFNEGFRQNPNPFSVFYKLETHQCISFSPERFLAVNGSSVFSQPMKGTAPRGENDLKDLANISMLKASEKDRRENVMIVDMVRNDLSHYAAKASVSVPELYKVATYPRVHQMYSTVKAELKEKGNLFKAILKCFPMGSMTGAPKISAMKIIEELEESKRGLFSGTIGYITPEKNADFNVIIRSLIYNEEEQILSCHVGGGITDMSDIEAEYEECSVKIAPILSLINSFEKV